MHYAALHAMTCRTLVWTVRWRAHPETEKPAIRSLIGTGLAIGVGRLSVEHTARSPTSPAPRDGRRRALELDTCATSCRPLAGTSRFGCVANRSSQRRMSESAIKAAPSTSRVAPGSRHWGRDRDSGDHRVALDDAFASDALLGSSTPSIANISRPITSCWSHAASTEAKTRAMSSPRVLMNFAKVVKCGG